jgi:ribonuclease HI
VVVKDSVGWSSTCSILTAEIAAISTALDYVQDSFEPDPSEFPFEIPHLRVTLFSDSQHALETIKAGNSARTGRALLRRIANSFYALQKKEIEVEFRWVPGHAGVCANVQAEKAAREAANQEGGLTALPARRIREAMGVIKLIERDRVVDLDCFDSDGLPGQYT